MAVDRPGSSRDYGALLGPGDPPAVIHINPDGCAPFLLIGDHAGAAIPKSLGDLGVGEADRGRHIAIDLGVAALGAALAARLDAPLVAQSYSRLVIDCNRDPDSPAAIPETSDGTAVPGNTGLTPAARAARVAAIHAPYQAAIAALIAKRPRTVLVSLHSFTPVMAGVARPWEVGVLHGGHADGFARRLLARLVARGDRVTGDNEPYRMDGTDFTVPRHAFPGGLSYVEIEVRQDLLVADPPGWADLLGDELEAAIQAD